MLLAVLLQSAAAAGLGKLGAALGAAIAVIGAGRRCGSDRHYCLFINFVLIINLACHY